MKQIIQYFFRGLLFTVPISIVVYVIYSIFIIIGAGLNAAGITVHPAIDPLIGLIGLIVLILIFGVLGSTIFFKPFFLIIESVIAKAPLINTFYSSLKDLMSALVGSKKKFNQPVLVKLSKEMGVEKLGFITREDLTDLNIAKDKVAVYLPHSFNFSGNLFIVPKENVTVIHTPSAEIMKFIVSGGISEITKG
ncbi:MAG: DUF502 domain-containing protein [Bacteroidetes bacterium]|nr:DUF502 domain-containing protein [Bacteroidota bacterium]HET6245634.1 DUF502 domain-containing protein [Bacteroidia bacterium]